MSRARLFHGLLAGAAISSTAPAQPPQPQEGPVIVGPRESWRQFELERLQASLEYLGRYRSDRVLRAGGPEQVDRETLHRETLNLEAQAAIGHKNLLDLTGAVSLGLEDRYFDSDTAGLTQHDADFVNLYDVRALMLGNGPVPLTLYTRREQSLLDRAFAGTFESTLAESGAIAQIRSERAPTTLQYFHRRIDQNDPIEGFDSAVTQDAFTIQSGIRLSATQRLDIDYTFEHIDEQQDAYFSDAYDRHDANLVHSLDFGPEGRQHELRSSLRLYDQGGRSEQRDTRWDELLVLRHTDRLETRYTTTVDVQDRAGAQQRLYRGQASVRHRLFESLISTASAGAQRLETSDGFRSDDWMLSGELDYTKRVARGRVDASAGASLDLQRNGPRGGTLSVLSEAHVFNDPFPIVLPRRNIVPGSIVVTPPSGFPPYVEGVDYTVRIFPDRAELTVPPGSAISDGQTVLASYDVGPEPESDIDTTGTTLSFRYTLTEGALEGLSLYTTYTTLDHSLNTADPSRFVLDDVRDLVVGIGYDNAGFDVKLEHQEHESTVSPFDSDRILASYQRPLGRGSSVGLQLTHESIDYSLEGNHVDFDRVSARWTQRASPSFDFNVRLEYRNEQSSLRGDSEGFDQVLGFTWHRGQTTVYGSFRNAFLDGDSSSTDSQLFQIGVRRAF